MTTALLIGSSIGAIIGLIHACNVYFRRTGANPERLAEHPVAVRAGAAYFALWTLSLWVVFGSYVFYLWVISVAVFTTYSAVKRVPNLIARR